MALGSAGAVSGLATAFPEVVAELVHAGTDEAHGRVVALRDALAGVPFHAAMKELAAARGAPVNASVRAPLRGLTDQERASVLSLLEA
jgi:dihydrodipicolinate synthase/N-acetylneuraminate lyase